MKDRRRSFELETLGIKEAKNYRVSLQGETLNFEKRNKFKFPVAKIGYEERNFQYAKIELNEEVNLISGFFQSPKYFETYNVEICNFLRRGLQVKKDTESNGKLVVHVRLGDMAQDPNSKSFHGIVSEKFLLQAVKKLGCHSALVVTDSPELLKTLYPQFFRIIDRTISHSNLQDFRFISGASKIVISNSTFSWWAAFLSEAEVVAPRNWFTPDVLKENPTIDLIPKNWIQL